jgi:hypothetical protein
VGLSKVLGDVLSAVLLDSWGRRPIMLTSSTGEDEDDDDDVDVNDED